MDEKMFQKVFDALSEHGPEFAELSRKTDAMIAEIIEGSFYESAKEDIEVISDACMNIISDVWRDSFVLGVRTAVKTIFALLCK